MDERETHDLDPKWRLQDESIRTRCNGIDCDHITGSERSHLHKYAMDEVGRKQSAVFHDRRLGYSSGKKDCLSTSLKRNSHSKSPPLSRSKRKLKRNRNDFDDEYSDFSQRKSSRKYIDVERRSRNVEGIDGREADVDRVRLGLESRNELGRPSSFRSKVPIDTCKTPSPEDEEDTRVLYKKGRRSQLQRHRRPIRTRRRRSQRRGDRTSSNSPTSSSCSSRSTIQKRPAGVVSDDEDVDFRDSNPDKVALTTKGCGAATTTTNERPPTRSTSSWEDNDGHFRCVKGIVVADRYRVIREVGLGTFGRVVECLDLRRSSHRSDPYVAIKIVRNIKRYYDSAKIEACIVEDINRHGGRGLSHCVKLHDSFSFDGHYCMVFESLGPSLYDFLKRHNYRPFPMVCVQDFAMQLLEALEFLHSMRLIHTDLKIENILLMNDREVWYRNQRVPESTKIKIIDFGGACYDTDKKSTVINTRQYRAPEVILGTGWSMPSDMWSAGCIFSELYQGELLFATHDNIEHLALIEHVIGYFPYEMIATAKSSHLKDIAKSTFDSRGYHRMERVLGQEKFAYVRRMPRLDQIVRNPHEGWFLRLLQSVLCIEPKRRATARECLQFLSRERKHDILS